MGNNRKILLNVSVDIYKQNELISKIEKDFNSYVVKTIFAVNPEKLISSQKDAELLTALKESDFLIPDGMGVVFGLRLLYGIKIERVTGIATMRQLLELSDRKKFRIFIFGSFPEVNAKAVEEIVKMYPNVKIVGAQHGYIPKEEYELLINRINSVNTDILFVGLGSPKQEKWIYRYKKYLNVKICMGVGGSLDVISKNVSDAPHWFQQMGLEWFYRLIKEPSRFKRQMALPKFTLCILKEKLKL